MCVTLCVTLGPIPFTTAQKKLYIHMFNKTYFLLRFVYTKGLVMHTTCAEKSNQLYWIKRTFNGNNKQIATLATHKSQQDVIKKINSIQRSLWGASSSSVSEEIPGPLWDQRFITVFTTAHPSYHQPDEDNRSRTFSF
jgi:hypothetical protein